MVSERIRTFSTKSVTHRRLCLLISNPQDRLEVGRAPIEKLGGKVKDSYFAFGPYDAILNTEMPAILITDDRNGFPSGRVGTQFADDSAPFTPHRAACGCSELLVQFYGSGALQWRKRPQTRN